MPLPFLDAQETVHRRFGKLVENIFKNIENISLGP